MALCMRDLENREIGREERDREIIGIMLKRGLSAEEVFDFTNYPIDLVKSVQKNLLETQ